MAAAAPDRRASAPKAGPAAKASTGCRAGSAIRPWTGASWPASQTVARAWVSTSRPSGRSERLPASIERYVGAARNAPAAPTARKRCTALACSAPRQENGRRWSTASSSRRAPGNASAPSLTASDASMSSGETTCTSAIRPRSRPATKASALPSARAPASEEDRPDR